MQKLFRAMHKNEKGFTLVELMVVVVIIGILVAIAIPIYNNVTENTQRNACFANQRTIEGVASLHFAEEGTWPADTDALVTAGYLTANPVCPATEEAYGDITEGVVEECDTHGHYRDDDDS